MLALWFAGSDDSLSVRRFSIREGLSQLFEVSAVALSPNSDIDLDAIVGRPASFQLQSGLAHAASPARAWTGICSLLEQIRTEPHGLSTYQVRIVPALWLLTQRRGYRVFQHSTIPDIVSSILQEWSIPATWRIDRAAYPRLEYRVAYDETDFAFVSRLLEEAGISYFFADDGDGHAQLVLADEPQAREPRAGGPIRHVDNPNQAAEREHVTEVRIAREIGPGRLTIRGFDFRRKVDVPLVAEAPHVSGPEQRLERHVYAPGAFLAEGGKPADTPVADDKGAVRADEKVGLLRATRLLDAERGASRRIAFRTNVVDLAPGTVFSIDGHAREDLGPTRALLATELHLEGDPTTEWTLSGRAVLADRPHRPLHKTPKPHVSSVQSAVVVGPRGEDIHTDELGRVRVQFHWDREGRLDENSSCWIRVSQGWAGGGFGLLALPRVGHEVVVGFFEGDPDQPVIVGRIFNGGSRIPYKLPEHRTVSAFRTATSPATGGYSELRFDDARGAELLHVQAERDLTKIVKLDETETTGRDRILQVGQKLTLTTGRASIILDGADISIEAEGNVDIRGRRGLWLNDEDEEDEDGVPEVDDGPQVEGDVEHHADGIDIKGRPEFRAKVAQALAALAKTRTGSRLLHKLGTTGKTVTIIASSARNGTCKPQDVTAASRGPGRQPGKGSGSTLAYNPDVRPGGAPSEAVLAFGLAQARMSALGMRDTGLAGSASGEREKAARRRPYRDAILVENEVRQELGLPVRPHY